MREIFVVKYSIKGRVWMFVACFC